jgi:hypothetical protein
MRVIELSHVLSATEGTDRRGRVLRILTDLPLSPKAVGHNAVKLLGLRKAIERIGATEPFPVAKEMDQGAIGKRNAAPDLPRREEAFAGYDPPAPQFSLNARAGGSSPCSLRSRR